MSPPKKGMVAETAQSRVGSMFSILTASVSPGSAPSMKIGPVCGFLNLRGVFEGIVSRPVMTPPNASIV